MIDTVFLDAGGVLVFPNWRRVADTLARHGVAADADALAAAECVTKRELDVPPADRLPNDRQRGRRYFDLILAKAGIPPSKATGAALADVDRYNAEWNIWEHVPSHVVPALQRLRARGLRLVVVSNSNGMLETLFSRVGLAPHVDLLFDSAKEGVEKPDPRFFQIALDRSGGRVDRTIHVGDLYQVDVLGARAAGLRAVLVDQADLYAGVDCPRVRSVEDLARRFEEEREPL
jgi:HAD superfamily hydrolase (TIGR01509 family)